MNFKSNLKRPVQHSRLTFAFLLAVAVGLSQGCSTSFKYTPTFTQAYTPIANQTGLAIRTGTDSRASEEIRPAWARHAEAIVAHALADEVRHAKLFERVKIHADSANLKKYSEVVQFRVIKFECFNQLGFLEKAGRDLALLGGIRGELIAASIPSEYVSEVEIQFEVFDAPTRKSVFVKSYYAKRTANINGYQGAAPKVRQTSDALESVTTQFLADLAKISARRAYE